MPKSMITTDHPGYERYLRDQEQVEQDKVTLLQMAREGQPKPRLRAKDPEERRLARALRSFTTPPERTTKPRVTRITKRQDGTMHWDVVLTRKHHADTVVSDETHAGITSDWEEHFEVDAPGTDLSLLFIVPFGMFEHNEGFVKDFFYVMLQKNGGDVDDSSSPKGFEWREGSYQVAPINGHSITVHVTDAFVSEVNRIAHAGDEAAKYKAGRACGDRPVMSSPPTPDVVGSSDNRLNQLRAINAEAGKIIDGMVASATDIRKATAQLIVAGVRMAEIKRKELAAWDEFREGFGEINVKGDEPGKGYREIATILWMSFSNAEQGPGSLVERRIPRDKVSLYAGAIAQAHRWFAQGTTDDAALTEKIIDNHGLRGCAELNSDRVQHKIDITKPPKAPIPAPSADAEDWISIRMPRPDHPLVIIVMPSGKHVEATARVAEHVLTETELPVELLQ